MKSISSMLQCALISNAFKTIQNNIMKSIRLFRSIPASSSWAAAALILLQAGFALAADSARVSFNDDWCFIKGDPADITDNLTYPRAARGGRGRGGAAATNAPART